MGLRDTLNDKPWIAAAVVLVILVAAAVVVTRGGRPAPVAAESAFFTVDDGKTWFADDAAKLAPFDHDGKPAVRAFVYRCGDGTEFANHLERFKPGAKKALETAAAEVPDDKKPPKSVGAVRDAYTGGREVKRPGEAKWVVTSDYRAASTVTSVKPPDGCADAEPVEP